jgi:stearoyl-CoA desaturase (delta-9 desaturase)
LFFGVVGINIGFHRYLTHRSFETNPIIDKFLLVVGCLCLVGTPLSWTISHINHHAYADEDGDPYSPHRLTLWNFLMTRFEPIKHPRLGAKTIFRNTTAMWLHENYFKVIIAYCILLALIDPMLVIYCWCIPSLLALYILLITNIVCHLGGYKNFDTKDQSHNNIFISIITLGEGWHNNHHADPSRWNQKIKWWELDPTSWIIKLIKK